MLSYSIGVCSTGTFMLIVKLFKKPIEIFWTFNAWIRYTDYVKGFGLINKLVKLTFYLASKLIWLKLWWCLKISSNPEYMCFVYFIANLVTILKNYDHWIDNWVLRDNYHQLFRGRIMLCSNLIFQRNYIHKSKICIQ